MSKKAQNRLSRFQGSSLPKGAECVIGAVAKHFADGHRTISKLEFRSICFAELVRGTSTGVADDLWREMHNERVFSESSPRSNATFDVVAAEQLLIKRALPVPGILRRMQRRQMLLNAQRAMDVPTERSIPTVATPIIQDLPPDPEEHLLSSDDPEDDEDTDEVEADDTPEDTADMSDTPRLPVREERIATLEREIAALEALKLETEREIDALRLELTALQPNTSDSSAATQPPTADGDERPWEDMDMSETEYRDFINNLLS